MERDENRLSTPFDVNISTHTLTWSVTGETAHLIPEAIISTHTLTWSVTQVKDDFLKFFTISTHTLTWSVT